MEQDTDVLLEFCNKSWDEVRHIEGQRAAIANIVILVSSAVVGIFVTQSARSGGLFFLSLIVLLAGMYGLAATAKLHERYLFELSRFSRLVARLDELHPDVRLREIREAADRDHYSKHALMSRVSINKIWICLHWGVIAVGAVLAIASWS